MWYIYIFIFKMDLCMSDGLNEVEGGKRIRQPTQLQIAITKQIICTVKDISPSRFSQTYGL